MVILIARRAILYHTKNCQGTTTLSDLISSKQHYTIPRTVRELQHCDPERENSLDYTIPRTVRELQRNPTACNGHFYYTIPRTVRELQESNLFKINRCIFFFVISQHYFYRFILLFGYYKETDRTVIRQML